MEDHFVQCTDVPSPTLTQGHEHRALGDSPHSFTQSTFTNHAKQKFPTDAFHPQKQRTSNIADSNHQVLGWLVKSVELCSRVDARFPLEEV